MKINFSKVGSGAQKIDRGEFAIQETSTKRQIDLRNDWETCFLPGQRVDMSMIFRHNVADHSVCPGCATKRTITWLKENETVDCLECGMAYSHHVVEHGQVDSPTSRPSIIDVSEPDRKTRQPRPRLLQVGLRPPKRKREYAADDDMRLFRRVRIIDEVKNSSKDNGSDKLVIGREVAYHDAKFKGDWIQCIVIAIVHDERPKQYGNSIDFIIILSWLTCYPDTRCKTLSLMRMELLGWSTGPLLKT